MTKTLEARYSQTRTDVIFGGSRERNKCHTAAHILAHIMSHIMMAGCHSLLSHYPSIPTTHSSRNPEDTRLGPASGSPMGRLHFPGDCHLQTEQSVNCIAHSKIPPMLRAGQGLKIDPRLWGPSCPHDKFCQQGRDPLC